MKLSNVNSTDLYDAIKLGCRTMGQVFNRDDNDVPFFRSWVWPEACLGYAPPHTESHVPGRHLNALLSAEALVGITADEDAIRKHANAAYLSFSGPIPLPMNRPGDIDGPHGDIPVSFTSHNIREGMHALYALARYRRDARADELMRCGIDFIFAHFVPQMDWDETVTANPGISDYRIRDFIGGAARCIGPLVKYYDYCGYVPALQLAAILGMEAVKHYPESGEFDQERMGTTHAHSIGCVMSSLAQLARTTHDADLMERVRRFYDDGLRELRNELGWATERTSTDEMTRGEVNTSGDILETALILGEAYGMHYYDDAERIIRGHILPSQLRDTSFIKEPDNPRGMDRLRDVANRHLGAFGFPAPFGHQFRKDDCWISFNMDIVGGTVASLCEAWAAAATCQNGIHRVNLLFDVETDAIRVTSPYSADGLTVEVKKPGPLFVRIPSWVDRKTLQVTDADWQIVSDTVFIPQPVPGIPIHIGFTIPERKIVLHHHTHQLRARLHGDIVLAMDNRGLDFTFFDDYTE